MNSLPKTKQRNQTTLDAAMSYIERGRSVFPIPSRQKKPTVSWGEFQTRLATPDEVKKWFAHGKHNIGIATGEISGMMVLDVDVDPAKKLDGRKALSELEKKHEPLPATVKVRTPRGGEHFYFRYPQSHDLRNSAGIIGAGLDIRANGGYVLAVPSIHPNGGIYEFLPGHSFEEIELAAFPDWLLKLSTQKQEKSLPPSTGNGNGTIPEGRRNATLASLAGTWRRDGMSHAAIEAALLITNREICSPLLDEGEVQNIARSIARYEPPPVGVGKLPLKDCLLDYPSLMKIVLPERKMLFPFLPEGGIGLVYAARGVGKTFFMLTMAGSISTGTAFFRWDAPSPTGVLYCDGEMDLGDLRGRATGLFSIPPVANLMFLTSHYIFHKLQRDFVLTEESVRDEVTHILDDHSEIRVLILDNISCLFSGIDEDSKRSWEPIASWLIRLRHRGITILLAHHAGKQGQQRGTSGREDSLDTVIQLKKPAGYEQREGCHFELSFEKCRSGKGEALVSLDAKLTEVSGALKWTWKKLEVAKKEQAAVLYAEGVTSPSDMAESLGIDKGYACRIIKKLKAEKGEV